MEEAVQLLNVILEMEFEVMFGIKKLTASPVLNISEKEHGKFKLPMFPISVVDGTERKLLLKSRRVITLVASFTTNPNIFSQSFITVMSLGQLKLLPGLPRFVPAGIFANEAPKSSRLMLLLFLLVMYK